MNSEMRKDTKMNRWTWRVMAILFTIHYSLFTASAQDVYNQIDESGNITQRNQNFNKHNNDTTNHNKEIPKGLKTWTVDRKFGNIIPAVPDTLAHLYPNTTLNTGFYGEYNTTGNNYTARLSRIFIDRKEMSSFMFTDPYSFFFREPEQHLFTNTLSPLTYVNYDNCGDKQNGEDRLQAKFAVNANKRLGFGFMFDYDYARGYFSNQSTSHFNSTLFGSYLGDRYNMHVIFSFNHQKASENGGILNDEYVIHPEQYTESYADNEIATTLNANWNRNDNQHIFLSHRYNIGFYRKVKMTDEEIKARKFAMEAKKEKEEKEAKESGKEKPGEKPKGRPANVMPKGRPEGAVIAGKEPPREKSHQLAIDSTRIQIDEQAMRDSIRAKEIQDSIDATMKDEYVPVTSIIHTLDLNNYKRSYIAYYTPTDYYKDSYYQNLAGDSIYDDTKHLQVKNTLGLALLEGFNKYMKAGLKAFVTHEYRRYELPEIQDNDNFYQERWTEHNISLGGQLSKTQGKTLHFNLMGEFWTVGEDAGQLKLDFNTDLNFPLFGDTVRLAAKAYFHRLNPTFYQRRYHSHNLWWDNNDMSKETRTRIEGIFAYEKTNTKLRVAVEEIQNYTYFGMSYDATTSSRKNMTAGVYQESGNINVLTAQLYQNFRLGPLNWENVITYQNSSNKDVLPLPTLNVFTNLYLKFRIARVLNVELGADATWFTKYYAPDFCPMINQFAIQQNESSRVEIGEYPFVDVYANLKLKGVRFFVMMTNVANGSGNRKKFLTPHYPTNGSVLHLGVSWNFFN